MLARGAGRSYGDAAQNRDGVVLDPVTGRSIELDAARGHRPRLRVRQLHRPADPVVPQGLLLPVLPGTRHVTVGGAVAADVHGKNQRSDGSIAGGSRRSSSSTAPGSSAG